MLQRVSPVAFTLLAALLAALVAAVLAWWVAGWPNVVDALHHLDPGWIALAALAELIAYVGYVLAYRDAVRVAGGPHLSLRRVGELVTAGFGAHVLAGGFAGDRIALSGECVDEREAAIRVLGLGALEYALLAPAATGASAFLLVDGDSVPLSFTVPWVAAVPVGFAIAIWASVRIDHEAWTHSPHLLKRWIGRGLSALALVRGLLAQPVVYSGAWIGITVYWTADILCLYAGLRAFGAEPSVPALIVAYATGYVASRRSLPLAGAAATEALLAFALNWSGIPFVLALLGVLAYRVFNFLLALPAGLVASWRGQRAVA
jgi:Lysylphosphatidylglycerol synthase TM region